MDLSNIVEQADNRLALWGNFLNQIDARTVAEIGVYKGKFAQSILKQCSSIDKYYMVDPWRNLEDWNKPANQTSEEFQNILNQALSLTDFAKEKRIILRGRTSEVISQIPDRSLDFVYIDGDHTLKGITIDLIQVLPKVKEGGFIGGDDFCSSIWQHSKKFEPTFVFPYSVYFAEAINTKIYAFPHKQFLIQIPFHSEQTSFEFIDRTQEYQSTEISKLIKSGWIKKIWKKSKQYVSK
jgi:hypothetical protein